MGDEREKGVGDAVGRITRLDEQPGDARLHRVADTTGPDSHHGHARGHGFQDDVAKRLGEAGKREDVAGGKVIGEVLSRAIARESGNGADSPFQLPPGGAVTHEQDPHIGPPGGHDGQSIGQVGDILLGGDPTHIADDQVVRPPAEALAHLLSPRAIGAEEGAVHTSRPEDQPLEAQLLKLLDRGSGGDVGLPGAVVKPAEIAPDRPSGPADPVMAAVLVEVGVEARDGCDPAAKHVPQHAEAECGLGGDVNQVGPERVDRPPDRSEGRQWKKQLLVKGHVDRSHEVSVRPVGRLAVVGVDQLDLVPPLHEMTDQFAQSSRHAVDLREVGLRDQADAHEILKPLAVLEAVDRSTIGIQTTADRLVYRGW